MAQSMERFIRKNGLIAGGCNLVINPALAWLGNREMRDLPVVPAVLIDTGITCMLMALLIGLFVSADTRRAAWAGAIGPTDFFPACPKWLSRLPARPWLLGVSLGGLIAAPTLLCLPLVFRTVGALSLSFALFALLKALYTPIAAYALARWVILRQLAHCGERACPPRRIPVSRHPCDTMMKRT